MFKSAEKSDLLNKSIAWLYSSLTYCAQEFLDECDHNPYTIQRRLREMKQSRVVEFRTENLEICKRLCDENVIDVEFSEAS